VLSRQLLSRAERDGDARFLRVGGGPWMSVGEVAERAARVAGGLRALAVERGDRVAILLPNTPEMVLTWFAVALTGAVEVPVNTALRGALLEHVLSDSGARVLVTSPELVGNVVAIIDRLPQLNHVVLVDEVGPNAVDAVDIPPRVTVHSWSALEWTSTVPPVDVGPGDPVAVMYTSGTTGRAKGVVCPHGYFSCWADDTGRAVGFEAGDVLYSPLPMFHLTGQCVNVQLALVGDGAVVMDQRFSPRGFWARMAEAQATHVWSFGPMTPLLFKQDPSPEERIHGVRVVWSIPFPAGFGREFEQRFGVRILCGYGSTEQGLTIVQPLESEQPDALGLASPHYEVDIVDERDLPVGDGGTGEIVVRPREPASMMTGYLNRAADTVTAWRNLWYHTGDRATRDTAGYFRFVDRKTDSIRRRGENISAWEIESVVGLHPYVEEVAAIGVPSELGEHEVKLVVVATDTVDERTLFDYCFEKLPYYMVPRYIELVSELPKTPSLRIEKYRLRELGVTPTTWDRESEGLAVRRPDGV
jgi:crotonobetaine/carnitine-CoA ligase